MTGTNSNHKTALGDIDRLIHEPGRLMVMALLYEITSSNFSFLMNQTGLSWGNLSAHMRKLEEAGYIEVEKAFKGRRPNTMLCLTKQGCSAFQSYRHYMKQILDDLSEQK